MVRIRIFPLGALAEGWAGASRSRVGLVQAGQGRGWCKPAEVGACASRSRAGLVQAGIGWGWCKPVEGGAGAPVKG